MMNNPLTPADLDAIRERADKAHEHLCHICKNPAKNFRMSIPAQKDDSDFLLSELLREDIPRLLSHIAAQDERVRELEGALDAVKPDSLRLSAIYDTLAATRAAIDQNGYWTGPKPPCGGAPRKFNLPIINTLLSGCEWLLSLVRDNHAPADLRALLDEVGRLEELVKDAFLEGAHNEYHPEASLECIWLASTARARLQGDT